MTSAAPGSRPKVAIVDDEIDFTRLIEHWLAPQYDVTGFTDGLTAKDALVALCPDLLIIDIHMPGCNGFQVSRKLRSQKGFEQLPVIFVTASSSQDDVAQYLRFKWCCYMVKPITGTQIKHAVSEQLSIQTGG
jgi:DNA-binding response OmpR family regulator